MTLTLFYSHCTFIRSAIFRVNLSLVRNC